MVFDEDGNFSVGDELSSYNGYLDFDDAYHLENNQTVDW